MKKSEMEKCTWQQNPALPSIQMAALLRRFPRMSILDLEDLFTWLQGYDLLSDAGEEFKDDLDLWYENYIENQRTTHKKTVLKN